MDLRRVKEVREVLEEAIDGLDCLRDDVEMIIDDIEEHMDEIYELLYEIELEEDSRDPVYLIHTGNIPDPEMTDEELMEDLADECDDLEEDYPGFLFEIDDDTHELGPCEGAPVPMVV